jgi:small GTP-binding protein
MSSNCKFKIAVMGDSYVGKTSLIKKSIYGERYTTCDPTIGVEYFSHVIKDGDTNVLLNIWDLSGHISYRSIIQAYMKHIDAVVLVYDVTNKNSFNNISKWMKLIETYKTKPIVYMLLANKIDQSCRVIDVHMGIQYAILHNMIYLDISTYKYNHAMAFLNILSSHLLLTSLQNNNTSESIDKSNPDKCVNWCKCVIL